MESPAAATPEHPEFFEPIKRLLIVRLGSMGDVIHTMPAVSALRTAFPQAEIGWVIEERWAELLCATSCARSGPRCSQRPLIDRLHFVNTKGWRKALSSGQTWHAIAVALSDLRGQQYQVALDFQGAIRSAIIARWSGAPIVYGATQPRENVASMFYSRQVMTSGSHVVEQALSLAEAVAHRELSLVPAEFPHDAAAERKVNDQLHHWGVREFVLLNPGAGWGAKQWPGKRYGEVAIGLAAHGLCSLINYGPGEEQLAKDAEAASNGTARLISCSIGELIALTRRARLFIGGDTGPMHLAAALKIPVVAIFGPTDPARNGPYGTRSAVLRSPLSRTSHTRRAEPDPGLLTISSEQVLAAARQLLEMLRG